MLEFDAIVLGLGGMGSATLYHLARRGQRVLGLERFDIPHDQGSSHGVTRIIRLAYYEHPGYVPLLKRSYELWRDLEREADERLLVITGSVDAGPSTHQVFTGSKSSCELHGLPHEVLTAAELAQRFPGYQLPAGHMALLQPEGGFLLPERCIVAHVNGALSRGAEVHGRERVLGWEPRGGGVGAGVEVRTERGTYRAARLVICAGAWAGALVPGLAALAVPERQALAWFQPRRPELFTTGSFPVFNLLVDEGRYYGFPVYGVPGFKIGLYHHLEQRCDPDSVDREVHPEDEAALRRCTRRYFPDADGPILSMKTCMFTNSPDEHFILDLWPGAPGVAVAAGFSGHGFKFCSVVGEIMADLALDGRSRHDLSIFRLARFAGAKP